MRRVTFLGASMGPGILVSAVLFTAGHLIIEISPIRMAVFFPALVFGWLRDRTGSIIAPALFHGISNVTYLLAEYFFVAG